MKYILSLFGILFVLATAAMAQLPEAPIEAAIEVSNAAPFVRETVMITLTVITRDIDIRQQLDLADLPSPDQLLLISTFEQMPVERVIDGPRRLETRRYQARARALKPGAVSLEPVLRLTAQRRVRSLFGSMIEEKPLNIRIPAVTLSVKPLPAPPVDFCGAVGVFTVNIDVAPTNLVAGDLLTVTTRIAGDGFLDDLRIPPVPEAALLKTYPVKELQGDPQQRRFAQTVIPKSEAVDAIPALSFSVFDTAQARYITHRAGPFPLQYRDASTRIIEQFRPDVLEDGGGQNAEGTAAHWRQRLAEGRHVSVRCATETAARLAPSFRSLVTFTIPADSTVQLHDRHDEWLLVEHRRGRGWIHQGSLTPEP